MKGTLYGIGTGPGDSSLLTKQALDTIKKCQVIALPSSSKENCTAYKIVKSALPEIELKEFLFLDFPMTKDKEVLQRCHKDSAEKIMQQLSENKDVAFITIGDVTVYSTFIYIQKIVEEKHFNSILINGIPSFCAAAARLNISLSEQNEEIHIIPGSYNIENSFNLNGTLIFMKSGKRLIQLKNFLLEKQHTYNFEFHAVSNCFMENEKIYNSINELSEDASYFTIVIIKNIKTKEQEKHYKFFQNTECENFPCHKISSLENFNCLFCYCPLYFLGNKCGGNFKYTDKEIKSCIECSIPHEKKNYEEIIKKLKLLRQ